MISDFAIDVGAAFVAVLFLFWLYYKKLHNRAKRLWERRKAVGWCIVALTAFLFVYEENLPLVIVRAFIVLFIFGHFFLWRKRYKKTKGKQRAIMFVPQGEIYGHRERMAHSPRGDAQYLHQDCADHWPYFAPNDLEAKNYQ